MSDVVHDVRAGGASGGHDRNPSADVGGSEDGHVDAVEAVLAEDETPPAEASAARVAGTLFGRGVDVRPERVREALDTLADEEGEV